jgi:hypothetical protein
MKRLLIVSALILTGCAASATGPASATPTSTAGGTASSSPLGSASTTTLPLGRSAAAVAYDQSHHNLVLFGGLASSGPLGDTWTWDGSAWTEHQGLTVTPSPRQGAAMAYDEVTNTVMLFGGLGSNGALNDTWAWDGSAWQQLHPSHSPSPREGGPATYDPALGAIVLFGGMSEATTVPSALKDTWLWNGSDWTQVPASAQGGGVRPQAAFLAGANLIERFGDCIESHDNTVYAFDGHTWVPKSTGGSGPQALCSPSMAGDPVQRVIVIFGGNPGNGQTPVPADTWTYDGNNWKKALPKQSPPARYAASMAYDPDHKLVVLFGGQGLNAGQSGPLDDTWTWDGSNWTSHQ